MVLSFRVSRDGPTCSSIASLNFPIMLFSKVFYPSSRLPSWMATFTAYNPVSYSADISRKLMFGTDAACRRARRITGFVVLAAFAVASSALVLLLAREWLLDANACFVFRGRPSLSCERHPGRISRPRHASQSRKDEHHGKIGERVGIYAEYSRFSLIHK